MKKHLYFLSFIFFSWAAQASDTTSEIEALKAQILESVTSDELMEYVHQLTDERFMGREAGSPEYMEAAEYVAGKLSEWGYEPLGDDNTFFQNFDWPYTQVLSKGALTIQRNGETITLAAPDDYYPGSSSDNGTITSEVVFAGFGISAAELGYDDYNGIDVKGKIVLIASGTPYTGRDADTLNLWGPYSGMTYKAENAHRKGAKGVLFADKLANPSMPFFPGFHLVHIDTHVSEKILSVPLQEKLSTIRATKSPLSFATGWEASITSETKHHGLQRTANVIGYLPGSDPVLRNEAIILGAHLDGQGYLGFHFPGALDNASGVADIMAVARALSHFKGKLKRSVVFIFFGAEEVGLVGSRFYCENPSFSQDNTLVFFNLDMVGNGTGLALWHGESYPEIYNHFAVNNEKYVGRSLRTSSGSMPSGRPRTDGLVFMMHGFRTLHVATTDRVNPMFYHDPRDVAENLAPDIMRDISRLLFLGVVDLANDETIKTSELFLIR